MILENEQERLAFNFVCNLASAYTDRICNDLNSDILPKFKGMKVEREEMNGQKTLEDIVFDFDVIFWLQTQIKNNDKKTLRFGPEEKKGTMILPDEVKILIEKGDIIKVERAQIWKDKNVE